MSHSGVERKVTSPLSATDLPYKTSSGPPGFIVSCYLNDFSNVNVISTNELGAAAAAAAGDKKLAAGGNINRENKRYHIDGPTIMALTQPGPNQSSLKQASVLRALARVNGGDRSQPARRQNNANKQNTMALSKFEI